MRRTLELQDVSVNAFTMRRARHLGVLARRLAPARILGLMHGDAIGLSRH